MGRWCRERFAGTVINFQWACVLPDRKSYYIFPAEFPLGFMDDGAEHEGLVIHSPRLPVPEGSPRISLREVKVMHFSTIDFERFKSKIRWYQCWEFSKHRWDGRLVKLYRWYHKDFCIPSDQVRPLPNEWIAGYGSSMHLLDVPKQDYYRWDEEMLRLFATHGTKMCTSSSAKEKSGKELGKGFRLVHKRPAGRGCGSRSPAGKELRRWRPARATGL